MPKFSPKSQEKLAECHPDLQRLFNEVVKHWDCAILEGHRPKEIQDEYFRTGKSKLQWPNGEHNKKPSRAVDAVPCPIDWNDKLRFYHFTGFVRGVASQLGIKIRCGADWDGDFDLKDQSFNDLPHFELLDK